MQGFSMRSAYSQCHCTTQEGQKEKRCDKSQTLSIKYMSYLTKESEKLSG